MSNQGEQFSILDAIAIVSFLVGLANDSENVDQSQLQETVNEAVLDIHSHLKEQDEKLNFLLNKLQEKED